MPSKIVIRGARVHNLKNIDLEIPREKLVVLTGVSGSGKSSLAFDTLYAEGQRRYVESLSAYARQFLERMARPDVDSIEGLSPAIAIEQRGAGQSPRSTVGTITEVHDFLRLLFARIGHPHCLKCGREIVRHTIQQVVDQLLALPQKSQIHILAPVVAGKRGDHRERLKALAEEGFVRVRIDGEIRELGEEIDLKKSLPHEIDLIVDRLVLKEGIEKRLADSLEIASRYGQEMVKVVAFGEGGTEKGQESIFSLKSVCVECGLAYPELTPSLFSFNSPAGACPACGGLGSRNGEAPCRECKGARLKKEALHVKIAGKNIAEIGALSIHAALDFFSSLDLAGREKAIAERILREIGERLRFLIQVGLDYLTLDRASTTLSGGEAQRIRLATQIGSRLTGVLYILDEPSIGLHQRDQARLLAILKGLRDQGNSVLLVEHDRETMTAADYIVDLGPGAGVNGGEVVARGTPEEIMRDERSLTGQYLSGRMEIPVPAQRRKGSGKFLVLKGARENNLKGITVEIPVGAMTCVTGVSGSGKSSLIVDTLFPALAQRLYRSKARAGAFDKLSGWDHFDRVINVDQSPIGRTPGSNPATYTGLFGHLRDLFSQLPEARVRGYKAGRFSFNVKGGRCEACQGEGEVRIEMHFLPDLYVTCEICRGRRYNRETLEVLFKGRNIADVLDLTVGQALEFLAHVPMIRQKLETLREVGLGYIRLGQPAPTLSGGEAQRIKLATELSRRSTGRSLYILDEPTTGLHFDDIKKLLDLLNRLTDAGNTVVIIEHNLDVIKSADYIIDLGPEGGALGGSVVATGSPEEISSVEGSYTGRFLAEALTGIEV